MYRPCTVGSHRRFGVSRWTTESSCTAEGNEGSRRAVFFGAKLEGCPSSLTTSSVHESIAGCLNEPCALQSYSMATAWLIRNTAAGCLTNFEAQLLAFSSFETIFGCFVLSARGSLVL